MQRARTVLCLMLAGAAPLCLHAQTSTARGEGAVVIADGTSVYKESAGSEITYTLNKGEVVASRPSTGALLMKPNYRFEPVDGRVRINFFAREPEYSEFLSVGWVDPARLSVFYFACCDPKGSSCGPADMKGLRGKSTWTSCFREARDGHLATLNSVAKATQTVELNYSEDQVRGALGEPAKILKLGVKSIWVYADVKITFEAGKVTNME
jgi:hypothetical protein